MVQPRALTGGRGGVGATVWDGALVLTAYLASQAPGSFDGMMLLHYMLFQSSWSCTFYPDIYCCTDSVPNYYKIIEKELPVPTACKALPGNPQS